MRETISLGFSIIEEIEPELTLGTNLDLETGEVEGLAAEVSGLVGKIDPEKKREYERRMEASSLHW